MNEVNSTSEPKTRKTKYANRINKTNTRAKSQSNKPQKHARKIAPNKPANGKETNKQTR